MTERGRPKIGQPIQIRLGELLEDIDTYAEHNSLTRASAIRTLLRLGLTDATHHHNPRKST